MGLAQMTGMVFTCLYTVQGITVILNDCEETDTLETGKFSLTEEFKQDLKSEIHGIGPVVLIHCQIQTAELPLVHVHAPETPPPIS